MQAKSVPEILLCHCRWIRRRVDGKLCRKNNSVRDLSRRRGKSGRTFSFRVFSF